jgi:hypothetical protein
MKKRWLALAVLLVALAAVGVSLGQTAGEEFWLHCTGSTPSRDCTEAAPPTATVTQTVTNTITQTVPGPTTTLYVSRRVLWGLSPAPAPIHHGTNTKEEEARYLEAIMGRKFDVTRHYLQGPSNTWTGNGELEATIASGRIPVFSFRAGSSTWPQIANGAQDANLRARLNELVTASDPLWRKAIIGFENEPEPEATGEGGTKCTAADYVRAFEHIISLAHSMGVPNKWTTFLMEWTWRSPNRNPEAWIPPHVDYLGVHGYGVPVANSDCVTRVHNWRTFLQVFDAPHATAVKLNKRMLVGETGIADDYVTPDPDRKANWFRAIPDELQQLPRLDVITYWHSGGGEGPFPGGCSWEQSVRIDSTAKSLQGYVDAGYAAILGAWR